MEKNKPRNGFVMDVLFLTEFRAGVNLKAGFYTISLNI